MEIWKSVVSYESCYMVSNLGRVKSLSRLINNGYNGRFLEEKILKNQTNKEGYHVVSLYKNNAKKLGYVHQLVADSFLNHKPSGYNLVINHKNFIRTDNHVENLEIITARENTNQKHLKSTSKYVGVYWHKVSRKWSASIRFNGKIKYIGLFDIEQDASTAYQKKLLEINSFNIEKKY